jgi:hypothetical protein
MQCVLHEVFVATSGAVIGLLRGSHGHLPKLFNCGFE